MCDDSVMSTLRRLWRLEGTVSRSTYLMAGVAGFASKYAIDWFVAMIVFGREWSPLSYWRLVRLSGEAQAAVSLPMFVVLFATSLPFLWFAMATTLLRLRDAGRSAGWAALLFVPLLNVLLFATLAVLPPGGQRPKRDLTGAVETALFSLVATVALAIFAIGLSTELLASYGVGLFVAVPFSVGYLSAFIHRRRYPAARIQPYVIALLSLLLLAGFLLALAWEGVLCLAMSAPLAIGAAIVGAHLGNWSAIHSAQSSHARSYMIIFGLPLLIAGEAAVPSQAPVHRVETSIVIDAPIDRVWSNVVTFSDIHEAPEWYFRSGIAYPIRARIVGTGAGATRYCEFTTGAFVEPITVWDAPRLLRFDVTTSPPPMRELSPYQDITPPHLNGFLVSQGGQFALRPLGANRTEVIGTTWYQHHLAPDAYWTVWSNAIIHRIHMRVLRHVKHLSESADRNAG
jgi:hypothetical protein